MCANAFCVIIRVPSQITRNLKFSREMVLWIWKLDLGNNGRSRLAFDECGLWWVPLFLKSSKTQYVCVCVNGMLICLGFVCASAPSLLARFRSVLVSTVGFADLKYWTVINRNFYCTFVFWIFGILCAVELLRYSFWFWLHVAIIGTKVKYGMWRIKRVHFEF